MHPNCRQMTHFWAAHCTVLFFEAHPIASSSCLHSGPNCCSVPAALLPAPHLVRFSLPCLFHYFLTQSAMNPSFILLGVFTQALYFSYLMVTVSLTGSYLVPGLFLGPAFPLRLQLPFHYLFQSPWPSSHHLLSLWKEHLCRARTNALQPTLPVQHQSSPHIVPGNPCCRVLERSDIFMKSMPDHNRRNYWGLHGYKSWRGK